MASGPDMRRHVAGLCALTRLALGEVERAGMLTDDQPELSLATLERWLWHEADHRAATEALAETEEALDRHQAARDTPPALVAALTALGCVAAAVREVAAETVAGTDRGASALRVTFWVEACLEALGEPADAVHARVCAVYNAAVRELTVD